MYLDTLGIEIQPLNNSDESTQQTQNESSETNTLAAEE